MGKKLRAAKASLVAAFLAAGGAAAAEGVSASAAPAATISGQPVSWGDPLIRFLRLDGFPAYLKVGGFTQLAQFYKVSLLADAATLYEKWGDRVGDLLSLYQKADSGPLAGILIGLEQYNKAQDSTELLEFLKSPGGLDAYAKFENFFSALQQSAREKGGALEFFETETGIVDVPAVQTGDGGIG
jgi:hypothetical protein